MRELPGFDENQKNARDFAKLFKMAHQGPIALDGKL
jgi:hypothetical protein